MTNATTFPAEGMATIVLTEQRVNASEMRYILKNARH